MKKTPDIVLNEQTAFDTDHKPRGSSVGVQSNYWSQNGGGFVSFSIGQFVLAKCSDGSYKGGTILSMSWKQNTKVFTVKLSAVHAGETIETETVKAATL